MPGFYFKKTFLTKNHVSGRDHSWLYCRDLVLFRLKSKPHAFRLKSVKASHALLQFDELLRFTHFGACWPNVAIYALCQTQYFVSEALLTILPPCRECKARWLCKICLNLSCPKDSCYCLKHRTYEAWGKLSSLK